MIHSVKKTAGIIFDISSSIILKNDAMSMTAALNFLCNAVLDAYPDPDCGLSMIDVPTTEQGRKSTPAKSIRSAASMHRSR